jgi:hypothetical protein
VVAGLVMPIFGGRRSRRQGQDERERGDKQTRRTCGHGRDTVRQREEKRDTIMAESVATATTPFSFPMRNLLTPLTFPHSSRELDLHQLPIAHQ